MAMRGGAEDERGDTRRRTDGTSARVYVTRDQPVTRRGPPQLGSRLYYVTPCPQPWSTADAEMHLVCLLARSFCFQKTPHVNNTVEAPSAHAHTRTVTQCSRYFTLHPSPLYHHPRRAHANAPDPIRSPLISPHRDPKCARPRGHSTQQQSSVTQRDLAESRWHHSGISLVSQRDLALPGVGVGVDVLRCAAGPG